MWYFPGVKATTWADMTACLGNPSVWCVPSGDIVGSLFFTVVLSSKLNMLSCNRCGGTSTNTCKVHGLNNPFIHD